MKCCGVDSYEDFNESKKWIEGGKKVPDACCVLEGDVAKFKPMSEMCPDVPTDINSYWKKVSVQNISPLLTGVTAYGRFP